MKKLVGLVVALLLTETAVWAQGSSRIYSQPAVPRQEALNRLNLKLAWRTYMPVDGRRDGFAIVQFLDKQMFVQMRSGTLIAINPETGETQWRTSVGQPYPVIRPVGTNTQLVFAVNGNRVYALDRQTGRKQWEYLFSQYPSTGVTADDERFYVCLGTDRLSAFLMPAPDVKPPAGPDPGAERKVPDEPPPEPAIPGKSPRYSTRVPSGSGVGLYGTATEKLKSFARGPQPELLWDYQAEVRLNQRPLQNDEYLIQAAADGTIFATSKLVRHLMYRFKADKPVSAPAAQYGDTAYAASEDFNVYALDIPTGLVVWKFAGGSPIMHQPAVTDEDIYVTPERAGLYRVDRATGEAVWRNSRAARYVASNPKYVYAMNHSNQLLVLDRVRGTQLSVFDSRAFVAAISNDLTDRIYLASHDGLLICLHDLDYRKPLRMNKSEVKPPPKPMEDMGEEKP